MDYRRTQERPRDYDGGVEGDTRGIMNEFRAKAYADGNPRIELNDSSALAEKEAYFGAPQPVA